MSPYNENDITLNKQNQIVVETTKSMSKTIYVKINAMLNTEAYTPVTIHVCGLEKVSVIDNAFKQLEFSFV